MQTLMRFRYYIIAAILVGSALIAYVARAASVTVCASACDYTTITAAIAGGGFNPGDSILVGSTYASTTETFPFNVPMGVNLDCQNSGAVIGIADVNGQVAINSQSDNIFRNCTYASVSITTTNQSNVQVLDNTFTGNSRITADRAENITIDGNGGSGLRSIFSNNTTSTTITSNTIMSVAGHGGNAIRINSATSVQVTSNIIVDTTTNTNTNYDIIDIINGSFDVYFASNTISEPSLEAFGNGMSIIQIQSRNVMIADNLITMNGHGGANAIIINGVSVPTSAEVRHNTILIGPTCNSCNGILVTTWTTYPIAATSTFNLIVGSSSSTANALGHAAQGPGPSSNLTLFTDYDGFSAINISASDPSNFPAGVNSVTREANELKIHDASSANDTELVPWSAFLDVNGSEDTGAVPGVRESTFQLDAGGVINYTTVDATNTTAVIASLRNGDTVNLANGTYSPINLDLRLTNGPLSGNISIIGSGPGTIIHASSTGNAFTDIGVSNSTFRDLTVEGATGTIAATYSMTRDQYTDGVTTYDQGALLGFPNGVLILNSVPSGNSCSVVFVDSDGDDVTSPVGAAADDWNLGLVDYLGVKITAFAPHRYATSSTDLQNCGSPGQITVEHFVPSIFTSLGNGLLAYNSAAASGAGVAPKAGETVPPAITRMIAVGTGAGMELDDTSGVLVSNVTFLNNSNGMKFVAAAGDNTVLNSTISGSDAYDVLYTSSLDNAMIDTSFDRTLSLFTGSGSLNVRYSVRVYVADGSMSIPLSGITVGLASANAVSSTSLVTGPSGYTSYAHQLPAFTLSSSSLAATNGGFNPYTFNIAAFSPYAASSTSVNLTTPFQTVTFAMTNTGSGGGGGGGGGGASLPPHGYATEGYSIDPLLIESMKRLGYAVHDLVKLPSDGKVLTQRDSTVYYLGADGRRHAFPNPSVYFSWYCNFASVRIISEKALAQIPLGRNVTYRPGLRLVKFPTAVTVYLVQTGGVLRPIPNEATAYGLVGPNWMYQISDINEAFYTNYVIGGQVTSPADLRVLDQTPSTISGNMNFSGYVEPPLTGPQPCRVSLETTSPATDVVATTRPFLPMVGLISPAARSVLKVLVTLSD